MCQVCESLVFYFLVQGKGISGILNIISRPFYIPRGLCIYKFSVLVRFGQ